MLEKAKAVKDESDRMQRHILVEAQEEDLVARKPTLATTLGAKDKEI